MFDLDSIKSVTVETSTGPHIVSLPPNVFSIDPSCIDADLCSLGRFFLYFGEIEAALEAEVERKENALKKLAADLDIEIRMKAKESNERITEAQIDSRIQVDTNRLLLLESLRESRKNYNVMRWVMRAMNAKKDALICLAYREKESMRIDRYSGN